MKKTLLYGLALLMAAGLTLSSCKKDGENVTPPVEENLAPTEPQNKTVVIEDFTGVKCGFCPDGHVRAKQYADANPGKVIVIAVHAGGYAVPSASQGYPDDFRTAWGEALDNQADPAGYPAGTVNRRVFQAEEINKPPYYVQKMGKMALGRGGWAPAGDVIKAESAPVNIGLKSSWDEGSRKLTITAETYYTAAEEGLNNLNIAILENGLTSTQSDYSLPSPYRHEGYIQNNVLRWLLTTQWGEKIENTTTGSRNKKTYTYEVPANFKIENLDIVAFVTRDRVEVLNALRIKAK